MKIIILSTSERKGGAAIAANRLMKAMIKHGVEAKMLVRDKQTDDENVVSLNTSWFKKKINFLRFAYERWVIFVHNRFSRKNLFAVSIANTGTNIVGHPLVKEADVIHLHWINQGFLSLKNIEQLIKTGKPIVWTMHDMWAFTGVCHHARECLNYQDYCGNCFFTNDKNLSSRIFSKKTQIWNRGKIIFSGCSKWLKNKAQCSALIDDRRVFSIPNPIDVNIFRKKNRENARKQAGFPADKYLLLFGAVNATDKRKGIDYLIAGLKKLSTQFPDIYLNTELVIFGRIKSEINTFFDIPIHSTQFVKDEETVVNLYNAVDLFITPSLEENLPNTIMEAMACGTPCVGFEIGGIPEMIDHKRNGYVAEYMNAEDLAKGIAWILHESDYEQLSQNARRKVVDNYSEEVVVKQYMELYNSF